MCILPQRMVNNTYKQFKEKENNLETGQRKLIYCLQGNNNLNDYGLLT